jgi:hypothetical protein
VQVAKHFIGAPATDKTDDVRVNASTKEGHGTTSTETASRDTTRVNTQSEVESGGTETKHGSDASRGNGSKFAGRKKTEIKRCSRGSQVLSKMQHTVGESKHRARGRVASMGMTNFFPPNCIFLVSEDKVGESGVLNVEEGGHRSIKDANADGEFDVAKTERSAEGVGGGRQSIFTGTVQVEKSNIGHVNNGKRERRGVRNGEGMSIVD